jgi:hypothetical protein
MPLSQLTGSGWAAGKCRPLGESGADQFRPATARSLFTASKAATLYASAGVG